tara:strand:- start:1407 stop:1733 length:327 start_codon:yes stop_codon:yes gene_type:complete
MFIFDQSSSFATHRRSLPNIFCGISLINQLLSFLLIMDKWIPSKKQQSGLISTTFKLLNDELTEMQIELNCPDEFVCEFLEIIKNRWSSDSCHSKARKHKRDNRNLYQ